MSKSYEKKKKYKMMIKELAKDGYINDASGKMIKRTGSGSMVRDYYPQR